MKKLLELLLERYDSRYEIALRKFHTKEDNFSIHIGLCSNVHELSPLTKYLKDNLPKRHVRAYSWPLTVKGHKDRRQWLLDHIEIND